MPSTSSPSKIRAFVQWREATVYAGEEIECVITFKNVARSSGQDQEQNEPLTPGSNVYTDSNARRISMGPSPAVGNRRASIAQNISQARSSGQRRVSGGKGHKPALSLSISNPQGQAGVQQGAISQSPAPPFSAKAGPGHGRSLSIMSLGSEAPSEGRSAAAVTAATAHNNNRRPMAGHSRSSSMQLAPKSASARASPNLNQTFQFPRHPSPLNGVTTPSERSEGRDASMPIRTRRQLAGTVSASNTPHLGRQPSTHGGTQSDGFDPTFEFPRPASHPQAPSRQGSTNGGRPRASRSPSNMNPFNNRPTSPRMPSEQWPGSMNSLNPIHRVMSGSSNVGDGSRASSEFYSTSNHSDETLTSELPYQSQSPGRLLPKQPYSRQTSRRNSPAPTATPETVMMAYVQTTGSFILDGSLVNSAPFEEIKRRGAQSSGGVVGVDRSNLKGSGGMFGGFSWGSINESLGGLLASNENSTIAQINRAASSKSVPLLSTPQSLLFVDIRLAPGESRSYLYKFHLPRGLPPSHERGRAIKVQYRLRIGVQRPEGSQAVKHIDVPFRVLGSVNAKGETLGHDLMSPYLLLQDTARTKSISLTPGALAQGFPKLPEKEIQNPQISNQGLEDFLRYTERLLDDLKDAHGVPISPSAPDDTSSPSRSRQHSMLDQPPARAKEAIDLAILRSNWNTSNGKQRDDTQQSANRFNIARSGQPVAILTILRPAFRLGEAVIGTLDFSSFPESDSIPPPAPVYGVFVELESAERVDGSLAMRSAASIQRVTRKAHASIRANTLFSCIVPFSLVIPSTATPTFETTGVSLVWRLRLEFTTQRVNPESGLSLEPDGSVETLLEELGRDERGIGLIAKEKLAAETFEVGVPLKVYGAAGAESLESGTEALEV